MYLGPDLNETLARALNDLRVGLPLVLHDGGEETVVAAVETCSDRRLSQLLMIENAVLVVTARRANTLKARVYDRDIARLRIPRDGNCRWARAVADPSRDLQFPLKGPFATERGGNVDSFRTGIELTRAARLLPAAVMIPTSDALGRESCCRLTGLDLAAMRRAANGTKETLLVASARLPIAKHPGSRIHVFRSAAETEDHCAIEIGSPPRSEPVLTRLHSACFTGDVLHSLKCDCGAQLNSAIDQMAKAGSGLLLYLNQEGRGIGLVNKIRAYSLQDQGFDTVESNHRLGFEDDERDFRVGAAMLGRLGFARTRLMTNNPRKVRMLSECGIEVVERVPLTVECNRFNRAYLETKASKSGHIL